MECTHFQLDLVIFYDGYADFKEIILSLEKEIIPNSEHELLVFAKTVNKNG